MNELDQYLWAVIHTIYRPRNCLIRYNDFTFQCCFAKL
jgi:hypothetical protein